MTSDLEQMALKIEDLQRRAAQQVQQAESLEALQAVEASFLGRAPSAKSCAA